MSKPEFIPIDQVIKDLKEEFEIEKVYKETDPEKKVGTTENKGTFHIDKRHFPRHEVLAKLQAYFVGKAVKGGFIEVSPITMVITTFHVKEGIPEQELKLKAL